MKNRENTMKYTHDQKEEALETISISGLLLQDLVFLLMEDDSPHKANKVKDNLCKFGAKPGEEIIYLLTMLSISFTKLTSILDENGFEATTQRIQESESRKKAMSKIIPQ